MAARQSKAPAAFLSYAHLDDEASGGLISRLRERLASAVSVAIGEKFEIFQDHDGIAWGQHWAHRLDEALEQALFLVPVLTPAYFKSRPCRDELEKFLELERRTGREDLILPIYFYNARAFEQRSDPLAATLSRRQYRDWRELRQRPSDSPEVRQALEQLADEIEAAVHRPAPAGEVGKRAPPPEGIAEGPPVNPPAAERPPDLEPIEEERRVVRNVALRAAPALGADTVTRLKAGAVVYVAGRARDSGWLRIEGEGDLRGYVVADAVEPPALPTPKPHARQKLPRIVLGLAILIMAGTAAWLAKPYVMPPTAPQAPGLTVGAVVVESPPAARPQAAVRDVQTLEPFRDCAECPEMVALAGGTFLMGSPEGEEGRYADEGPRHEVTVAPFAIGKYEVTFAEWDACVAAGGCSHEPGDRGWDRGRRPVINVSWNDAREYVAWLSRETDATYRLPSEAEWEYAARAGTTTRYWWGDAITPEDANYGGTVGRTTEVGSYPANAWGLHDMHGNVLEWVEDRWHENYEGAPSDGSAWLAGTESARVVRGGSWLDVPRFLRSACRGRIEPDYRYSNLGFRVARMLTP